MCLTTITTKYDPPYRQTGIGWKVFILDGYGLTSEFFSNHGLYRYNRWYTATDANPNKRARPYTMGFHVFNNRKDAKTWITEADSVIRKVKYRGVTTVGTQTWIRYDGLLLSRREVSATTVVAKEMLILPPAKRRTAKAGKRRA